MRLHFSRLCQLVLCCCVALFPLFVLPVTQAHAAQHDPPLPVFRLVKRLPLPLENGCFDGWARDAFHLYLADPSHRQIAVLNERTMQLESPLGTDAFPAVNNGPCPGGPLELAVDHDQLWASNETSSLLVFDVRKGTFLRAISTGGQGGTDGLAFDPQDDLLLAVNPDENQSFLTLVGTKNVQVRATLSVPGAGQPLWDAAHQRFLLAISPTAHTAGGIAVLAITPAFQIHITQLWPLPNCEPTGLTLGTPGVALVGCGQGGARLFSTQTGQVLSTVPSDGEARVDLVSYDAFSHVYALATFGPTTGAVDILDRYGRVEQRIGSAPLSHDSSFHV